MARADTERKKRIQAAKTWLAKAEKAYAEDSSAKGQLQVMLAKAELQRLEESTAPSLWRRNSKVFVALGCVVIIGVAYIFGPLVHKPMPASPKPIDTTIQTKTTAPPAVSPAATTKVDIPSKSDTATAPPIPDASVSQEVTSPTTSASTASVTDETPRSNTTVQKSAVTKTSIMSDSQIRAAVRDGGRSLRGQ